MPLRRWSLLGVQPQIGNAFLLLKTKACWSSGIIFVCGERDDGFDSRLKTEFTF